MTTEQTHEIPQPIKPVQPVLVEPKRKSILRIIVISLIVISLIAVGVVLGMQIGKKQVAGGLVQKITPTQISQPTETPEPDETASWKTYKNEKYGFEFKYPISLTLKEETYDSLGAHRFAYFKEQTGEFNYPGIYIGYYENKNSLPLKEWLTTNFTQKDNYNNPDPADVNKLFFWGVKNIKEETINNLLVVEFNSSNYADSVQKNALIAKGDKIIAFQFTTTMLGSLDKYFDQILSTFRFD